MAVVGWALSAWGSDTSVKDVRSQFDKLKANTAYLFHNPGSMPVANHTMGREQ